MAAFSPPLHTRPARSDRSCSARYSADMAQGKRPSEGSSIVVGVDLGGTNLQAGVVDASHRIIGRSSAKTEGHRGMATVLGNLVHAIRQACRNAGIELDEVAAVGVCAAGAIDIPRGVILTSPNLGWIDVPFRDLLGERLERPIVLDNDVNGAAWGEHHLGAGDGTCDALGVWVGTGVGGGLIINNTLIHGDFFTAGEIGHVVIRPDQPRGHRKVEDLCSRNGIKSQIAARLAEFPRSVVHDLVDGDSSRFSTATLKQAYDGGDDLVTMVIDEAADLLGCAIANVVTLLGLRKVYLGGGIAETFGRPYLERVAASMRSNVFPPRSQACEILMTKLGPDSGLLGAALLAFATLDDSTTKTG